MIWQDLPKEWPAATLTIFKDEGATYSQQSTNYVQRWEIHYDGLTEAQAAILDDHHQEALGMYGSFALRHPRTGRLFTDCHYESYSYPDHQKIWGQSRIITIIKRPPHTAAGSFLLEGGIDHILMESGGRILLQD